jgi:hypothetical protein
MRLDLFPAGARDGSAVDASPARLVNLYREPAQRGGRTANILRAVYGMQHRADLGGVLVLDMFELNGVVYALRPFGLSRYTADGAVFLHDAGTGETGCLSRNLDLLTGCIGGRYFVLDPDSNALTFPETNLPGAAWVDFLAGRTLVGEAGTAKFVWSAVADPATFDGLQFGVAESRADKVIRGVVVGSVLMLFGEQSTEFWAPSGAAEDAFAPLPGAVRDVGLRDFGLICKADSFAFLVGSDGIAYIASGTDWRPVSGPAIHYSIEEEDPQTCLYWEERGHKFCAITFKDRPAWVYDLSTGEWFERGLGLGGWPARASAKLGREWLVGTTAGQVFGLVSERVDAGQPMVRQATSLPVERGGAWFRVAALELHFSHGFAPGGFAFETGNGVTFTGLRHVPFPGVGRFDGRVVLRALGAHQRAVFRVTMTDPTEAVIYTDSDLVLA